MKPAPGLSFSVVAALVLAAAPAVTAQSAKPLYALAQTQPPDAAGWQTLKDRRQALVEQLEAIRGRVPDSAWAEAAVYAETVGYLIRYPDRFYVKADYGHALRMLELGTRRASDLAQGRTPWSEAKGFVARAYRSCVDGSLQPFGMAVPASYDPARPMRLDVILHGRNTRLNGVGFLASVEDGRIAATEPGASGAPECLKLYVFGRGNNSYRWAGEADVFEALASAQARYRIDPDRIVLRGFSMGGAGAWHLGLHYPSRWAAVEAGAGYVQTRPEVLATIHEPWRLTALAIHDASNCATNLLLVPWVAYAGSEDPTLAENQTIRQKLADRGIDVARVPTARFLVGQGTNHHFLPASKRISGRFIAASLPRRRPDRFAFTAYTPEYGAFWDLQIESLDRLYARAEVRGTWDDLTTTNVWVLRFATPRTVRLDGQSVTGTVFQRTGGRWRPGAPAGLHKRAGLQGPIDDAFGQPFLCVAPASGIDPTLASFREDFGRYSFGQVRTRLPAAVTGADLRDHNLILFGTPETNPLIRRVLPGLPIRWTAEEIRVGDRRFPAHGNTVALIYPNPLNPSRYVVLNSGQTFPGTASDDMHWYIHPRLGDIAVLDAATRTVRWAGFFDREWRLPR